MAHATDVFATAAAGAAPRTGAAARCLLALSAALIAGALAPCLADDAPAAGVAMEAPEVLWYSSVDEARARAQESGLPVYVYIYWGRQKASQDMRDKTFADPQVAVLLQQFVCCALEATDPAHAETVDKYATAVSTDEEQGTRFGSLPAHLFTDATGKEYYICWGYMPPEAYPHTLTNVLALAHARATLAQTPDDPRANADLGDAMLELSLLQTAREPLTRAVAGDPGNKVGAREDASLNLAILDIPQDPAASVTTLNQYLKAYPQGRNLLKARYYLAAALAGQDDRAKWAQARTVLTPFHAYTEGQPEYTSRWTLEALKLDALIKIVLEAPPGK
jgi:hypothetical protein